ncbi:MAG: hypothetical protein M1839_004028 [Geoglossum umbratile]|nr:MAG: hypothetical protein M1839_004028 [Geoglossum umbratile]
MRGLQLDDRDDRQRLAQADIVLEGLNAAQRTAVSSPAPVLQVLAPPGSGKTKTLTARVAYLLCHEGLRPWNVIVATFTVKAAREMKERIGKLIGDGLEAKLVLGTFHSIARRYLVRYGHLIDIDKEFGIADGADSLGVIKRIIKRLKLSIDPNAARSRISNAKAKGIGLSEYMAQASKKKGVDVQEFAIVYEEYEHALAKSNLLDYDDLLLRCVELLRQHPSCVSNVEAVLIDEFQDTNLVQFDLMTLFAAHRKKVTIVGDPDQSIYGFRSAEIKNLKRMRTQYLDTLVVILEENYRSSGAILLAALEVIQQDESRPAKSLLPTHCVGTKPILRKLPSAGIEALWIVSEIKRAIALNGNLLALSDIAILIRSAFLSRHIESALGQSGIPYRMVGGHKFFDRFEVKIVLDYLRVISQPHNNDALARIINVPPRRVGDATVKALLDEAETHQTTLWSLVKNKVQGNIKLKTKTSAPAEQGLSTFMNIILSARKRLLEPDEAQFSLVQLVEFLMKKLSLKEYLEKSHPQDHETRWANIEELVAQASDFSGTPLSEYEEEEALPEVEGIDQRKSSSMSDSLSRFLANVALSSEAKGDDEAPRDQVTISTIHAAKGLEWPVVFIPAVYHGSIPHSRAEDVDEERRLLYVAMTRAMALLYMSCPMKNSQKEQTTLSEFLSHKSLTPHLEKKGPSFKYSLAQSIARILNRNCPSEASIMASLGDLETVEDDLWPITGEANEIKGGREEDWEVDRDSLLQDRAMKRRRLHNHDMSQALTDRAQTLVSTSRIATSATTMQSSAGFSIASTTMTAGFVSAGSYLQGQGKGRLSRAADEGGDQMGKRGMHEQVVGPIMQDLPLKTAGMKAPKRLGDQPSLTNFFAKTASDKRDSHTEQGLELSRLQTTMKIGPSEKPIQQAVSLHRLPQPAIPAPLANHRPRAAPLPRIPPKPTSPQPGQRHNTYVFLSSSPSEKAHREGEAEPESPLGKGAGTPAEGSGIRPAESTHATAIVQAQAACGGGFQRRTLGVRRSLNGWANRAGQGQGFVVPSRRQN